MGKAPNSNVIFESHEVFPQQAWASKALFPLCNHLHLSIEHYRDLYRPIHNPHKANAFQIIGQLGLSKETISNFAIVAILIFFSSRSKIPSTFPLSIGQLKVLIISLSMPYLFGEEFFCIRCSSTSI